MKHKNKFIDTFMCYFYGGILKCISIWDEEPIAVSLVGFIVICILLYFGLKEA